MGGVTGSTGASPILSDYSSMLRQTHTYATLEISPVAFDEITTKLRDAGYLQLLTVEEKLISMAGIAIAPESPIKELKDKYPVVLYFDNRKEAMEFKDLIATAKPNWVERQL